MLGKLASLKIAADNLSYRSGLSSASSSDPTFDALLGRSRCLRAEAACLSEAAAGYAAAAQGLGRAAEALSDAALKAGGHDLGAEVGVEIDRVRDVAEGLARSGEIFASAARRRIDVGLAGIGEDAFTMAGKARTGVEGMRARLARAERKGGTVGEGRAAVESIRESLEKAMNDYVVERGELGRKLDAAEVDGEKEIGEELKEVAVGVRSVLGGEAPRRGDAAERVDWLTLADELRCLILLKFPDAAVKKLLPACWNVAPVVLSKNQLRCMTLTAPDAGEVGVEAQPLHFESEAVDVARRASMACQNYVVVKGTNFKSIKHVLLDLNTGLTYDRSVGCFFHNGFYEAGVELHSHLVKVLDPDLEVHCIGHSLGGAACAVAAMLLRRDGYEISSLHLFGTPRFTNDDGASLFNRAFGTKLLRVAQYDDPIRGLPPPGRQNYRHVGNTVLIQPDDTCWVLDDSPLIEPLRGVSTTNMNVHRTSKYALSVARVLARRLGTPGDVTEVVQAAADAEMRAMLVIIATVGPETALIRHASEGSPGLLAIESGVNELVSPEVSGSLSIDSRDGTKVDMNGIGVGGSSVGDGLNENAVVTATPLD